jgi:hypothetical protein
MPLPPMSQGLGLSLNQAGSDTGFKLFFEKYSMLPNIDSIVLRDTIRYQFFYAYDA